MPSGADNQYLAEHGEQIPGLEPDYEEIDQLLEEDREDSTLRDRLYSSWDDAKDWYYEPRDWERWRDGLVYRALGVDIVKRFNPNKGPYISRALEKLGYDVERPVEDAPSKEEGLMDNWLPETRFNEKYHAPFVLPFGAWAAAEPHNPAAWGFFALHGYSTMVNRYNRARIHNHLDEHAPGWREADEWSDDLLVDDVE